MYHDAPVRNARDRLIDLLGIGSTYPLTDLDVVADQLKVAFGGTAKIPIIHSQAGVRYQLCDPRGESLGKAYSARGNDDTLVIETPKVTEDVTYRIRAAKVGEPGRWRFLDEGAPVKVGIDTRLAAGILGAEPLQAERTAPSDPRIIGYGEAVDVQVEGSQEGVKYSLVVDGVDIEGTVNGNLGSIVLDTGPMFEDALIKVRATKTFPRSKRPTETETLDANLYLKVTANPAIAVSTDPSPPIVDHLQGAAIRIVKPQKSVRYRAYMRAIPDRDFVHGDAADTAVVTVAVAGDVPRASPKEKKPPVQVRMPDPYDNTEWQAWRTPDGYLPLGDGPAPGDRGDLLLAVPALAEDVIVIVQAVKAHGADVDKPASVVDSSIRLDQAAVVLVRPDPAQALVLRAIGAAADATTVATLEVTDGQPGVFYYFGKHPRPAYFNKRDDQDDTQNKGIDQLGVEIDFTVAADPEVATADAADRASTAPRPPLLDLAPAAAVGSTLSCLAVKAQTLVEVKMPDVTIPKPDG